jgi:eukaryotic-like serine/threonine-protein kinase
VGPVIATEEISKGSTLAERYRVLHPLGTGGMATVFLAEDDRLGREVAIKRLHTDAPKTSVRRFRNEARLGAALNHAGFVAVYDTLVTDEGALIVMEHVPGSSLAELAGGRRMRAKRALPILRSVAEALDHAHAQGVVHRDVKPANILVRKDGVVKLADLGIARAIGANQITSEGSVVGTLPYMAPERLEGPGGGGPEADVYALAAVAYELLSGKPPNEATSGSAAAQAPPDLLRDWPKAPPAVVAVLERGLDPDPARRQRSAGQLVEELEAASDGRPDAESPPAPTSVLQRTTIAQPTVRLPRIHRGLNRGAAIGAIGLVLMALAAIAIAGGGGGGGPEQVQGTDTPGSGTGSGKDEKAKADEPSETGVSDPAALNDLGFSLINEGRYEEAIPILQRAVNAFPEGSREPTYAYALFNLGHALRLAGRPEEAIPVLEQRLEIPNQTEEVQRELEAAYADAGYDLEGGEDNSGPGNGKGLAKGHDKD